MTGKRNLSIGITVNLRNYENLKLEAEGEVESAEDVSDLIEFLKQTLDRFGTCDQATREQIENFKTRLFPATEGKSDSQNNELNLCEKCGAEVTESELKKSKYLANKILCTKCFENIKKVTENSNLG